MRTISRAALLTVAVVLAGCADGAAPQEQPRRGPKTELKKYDGEPPITQLTWEGKENSEAYFSPDMKLAVFQGQYEGDAELQVYTVNLETRELKRVTNNKGKNVCTFFSPDGKRVLFGSTMSKHRPADDVGSYGTMWAYDRSFEIYTANVDGTDVRRMTDNNSYECEGSFSPDGKKILYTSDRDGNLELYTMDIETMVETRLTSTPDLHEGGSFFSPDGKKIVYRAWAPVPKGERAKTAQVYVMNADGSNPRQVTKMQSFNWSPYYGADNKTIVFASNYQSPNRKFDIYLINEDGTGLKKLTTYEGFDSYPVMSPDGKKLLFTSDRYEGKVHVFLMDLPQ